MTPSTGFARLMALSAQHTKESAAESQALIAERQRKERERRQAQEEKERKEREMQAEFRRKQFERERLEKERRQKLEDARRKALEEQEDKRRNSLLHGPKAGSSKSRSGGTHHNSRGGSDDSDGGGGGMALTREEKRQRKLEAELNRASTTRRSIYTKTGKRLAGGAINLTTEAESLAAALTASPATNQSIKQRIAALPNTLQQLNKNKRDVRTIDEILQDRAKEKETKVLDGDQARSFHDWFNSKPKKNDPVSKISNSAGASMSPSPSRSHTPLPPSQAKSTTSGNNTPAVSSRPSAQQKPPVSSAASRNSALSKPIPKNSEMKTASISKTLAKTTISTASKSSKEVGANRGRSSSIKESMNSYQTSRKRQRSPSSSISPPPKKRSSYSGGSGISEEIWKLFGKDRGAYVGRDVLSDDEDMEADAEDVRREEMRSARLAKREDDEALEEERRHEEEKRRRKKESLKDKKGY